MGRQRGERPREADPVSLEEIVAGRDEEARRNRRRRLILGPLILLALRSA
jgi:hypothetical protein